MPSRWSEVSDEWVEHTESDDVKVVRGVLEPLMLGALQPEGRTILDLGCGEGYFARVLRNKGAARVVGVDIAPALVERARERDAGGEYHVHDIESGPFFDPGTFGAVSASMVLMYMKDLNAAFRNISTILSSSGLLVASIVNPYYADPVGQWGWALEDALYRDFDPGHRHWKALARQLEGVLRSRFDFVLYVKNYFETREVQKRLTAAYFPHVHRPFSDYLNLAERNGLHFQAMHEPKIAPELKARYPDEPVARALEDVPLLFLLEFRRA